MCTQIGHVAKTDLAAQGVERHFQTRQGLQQAQAVKSAGHHHPRRLTQRLTLCVAHGPFGTMTLKAANMLAPKHLHTRRLQLRGHQLARPNPARLRVPQRWRARGQTGCGYLGRGGQSTRIGLMETLRQSAFGAYVVLQNARQVPVGAALQQGLGALQCGMHACAGDARQDVVIG